MKKFITIFALTIWFYLCMCVIVSAQTELYRSIQNNTSAIATNAGGTVTLTISGSTATFSSALPDSVGVGCVIQYDKNDNGTVDNLAFIHGRTSSKVFTVKDSLGAAPDAVTGDDAWSIFHAYTDMGSWNGLSENSGISAALRNFDQSGIYNLVANNTAMRAACYNTTLTHSFGLGDVWICQPGNDIEIFTPYLTSQVGVSQRGGAVWDNSKFTIQSGANNTIFTYNNSTKRIVVKWEGIQFSSTNVTAVAQTFTMNGVAANSVFWWDKCKFRGVETTASFGFSMINVQSANASMVLKFSNNYIYDYNITNRTDDIAIDIEAGSLQWTSFIYNNTFFNCGTGIKLLNTAATIYNNILECATDGYSASGTGTKTEDYNISNIASDLAGGNSQNEVMANFTDDANDDFSLTCSDAVALGKGTNLSGDSNLPVTEDIIPVTRTVPFSVGAQQPVCGGLRRWIVQSMLPEIFLKYYLYILIAILMAGTGLGIYRHFFYERKIT